MNAWKDAYFKDQRHAILGLHIPSILIYYTRLCHPVNFVFFLFSILVPCNASSL